MVEEHRLETNNRLRCLMQKQELIKIQRPKFLADLSRTFWNQVYEQLRAWYEEFSISQAVQYALLPRNLNFT